MSDEPASKRPCGWYKCDICEQRGMKHSAFYHTILGLKRHIFAAHLGEKGFVLRCSIDSCPVQLQTRRQLYNHVSKCHPGKEWIPFNVSTPIDHCGADIRSLSEEVNDETPGSSCPTSHLFNEASPLPEVSVTAKNRDEHDLLPTSECEMDPNANIDEDVILFKQMSSLTNEQRQLQAALSVASLKANYNISQAALEAAQQWAEGLLSNAVRTVIGGVKLATYHSQTDMSAPNLDDVFELGEGISNPFQGLTSEGMLKKILKDKLGYVEPETVVLREALNEGLGGQAKIHTMQYVPILEVIKLLYRDKNFRFELTKRRRENSEIMTDFMDGDYFQRHPLFAENPNALQIQLYYDGFEVVNPLGSKIGRHNVGALYFSILNLEPVYRSTLKSICLAGLLYESDTKHPDIGWEVILRRFNSDLKDLENGFHFAVDGEEVFVQGTIAQCALDNKAAHSLFGLIDCFHGNNVSRYCLCSTADIQVKKTSKECVIRDRQGFNNDQLTLEQTGGQSNGVKARCYIDSKYFHRADAFAADIHHDVMEGLIPGMLKPILQQLILEKKLFTIDRLNNRIANFNYNRHDIKNRPSLITDAKLKEDSRNLKQYASQYWCLLRKLPLIVGDLVPEGDTCWRLLLLLLEVVDLIMSPTVDDETLSYLEMQLCVLFSEFRGQFPEARITPKMHYTLHYPRLMKEVGPLIRHWVMRFEAKHHFFKRATIVSGNYINIPRSLALRHQMLQVVHVHHGGLVTDEVSVTDGHPVDVADIQSGADVAALLDVRRVTVTTKVSIYGTVYKIGDVILIGFDCASFVKLGEITNIFVSASQKVCFLVNKFDVVQYDEHFHSWEIEKPRVPQVVAALYNSLPDYYPVSVHNSFGDNNVMYASLRYNVCPGNID